MMNKFFVILCACVLLMAGCNQPLPPAPGGPTTTITDATGVLGGFMGTACMLSKTYIMIDSYWGFVSPFLPAAIKGNALPVLNMFLPALKAYDQAVITWYETKTEPGNWVKVKDDVMKIWADIQPLIEKIKTAIANNKKSTDKALLAVKDLSKETQSKPFTSCPIAQLKEHALTLDGLKPLT
jgi:hypothetical protein